MTSNQIAYKQAKEQARSNRAKEKLEEKNIRQRERSSRRQAFTNLVGSGVSMLGNDPSWYTQYNQLAKDAAQISFQSPLGTFYKDQEIINVPVLGGEAGETQVVETTNPGVMVIPYVPTFGKMTNLTDPANLLATKLYSWVRHANSGSRNYDIPDLSQYVLAVTSAYSLISYLRKLYGVATTFSPKNKYKADALILGLGFSPEVVYRRLPEIRSRINVFSQQINAFAIPSTFNYLTRALWLNENIWLDAEVEAKAQMYMFVPASYWFYHWEEARLELRATPCISNLMMVPGTDQPSLYTHALAISTNALSGNGDTLLDNFFNELEEVIISLSHIEDVGIMSGDVIKAFGDKVFKAVPMDENYKTNFVYNEEVLDQIHNITPYMIRTEVPDNLINVPTADFTTGQKKQALATMITQNIDGIGDGRALMWIPEVINFSAGANDGSYIEYQNLLVGTNQTRDVLLDSIYKEQPDAGHVLVMSRGTVYPEVVRVYDTEASVTHTIDSLGTFGSEIFMYPITIRFGKPVTAGPTATTPPTIDENLVYVFNVIPNNESFVENGSGMSWGHNISNLVSKFKAHPQSKNLYDWGSGLMLADSRDITNAAILSTEDMKRLHYVALNSLFYIPEYDK